MPNSSRKNRLPATNCRARASPPGRFVSDSTHMPPTGIHRPSATRVLDAGPDRRVAVTDPGVLLGGRAREREVRVAVHQVEHVREGAGALADRLAQPATARPSRCARGRPRRRDRRTRTPRRPTAARARPGRRPRCRRRRRGRGRRRHARGAQQVRATRAVRGELPHQATEDPEVLLEFPHGVVALDEFDAADPVDRVRSGGGLRTERRRALERVAADVGGLAAAST